MGRRRADWWPWYQQTFPGARVSWPSFRQLLPRYNADTCSWASHLGLWCREEQAPQLFSIRPTSDVCFRKRWVLLLKSPFFPSDLGDPSVPGSAADTETCLEESSLPAPWLLHHFCSTVAGVHTLFLGVTLGTRS